jgi:hypothetical protein
MDLNRLVFPQPLSQPIVASILLPLSDLTEKTFPHSFYVNVDTLRFDPFDDLPDAGLKVNRLIWKHVKKHLILIAHPEHRHR